MTIDLDAIEDLVTGGKASALRADDGYAISYVT
jgi:hypothetical protein